MFRHYILYLSPSRDLTKSRFYVLYRYSIVVCSFCFHMVLCLRDPAKIKKESHYSKDPECWFGSDLI